MGRYWVPGAVASRKRLDGEIDAAPGLKISGAAHQAQAELVERARVEVIVTANLDPLMVTALPARIERRSRTEALSRTETLTESWSLCP